MRKLSCIIIYLCLTVNFLLSQTPNIDSLKQIVSIHAKDTNTVVALRMLCGVFLNSDQAQAIEYGKQGVAIGKQIKWNKGIAGCYLNISVAFTFSSKFDSALVYQDSALIYAYLEKEPKRLALIYLNRGDIYLQLNIFDKAVIYCDSSSRYAEIAKSEDRQARILQTIGSIYFKQEVLDKAIEYYDKSLVLYKKINNMAMASIVINNLANIYKRQKLYDKAIENFNIAIQIGDSINDLNNMAMYYGNMGEVYFEMQNYFESEKNYNKAIQFALAQSDSSDISMTYTQLAELYLTKNDAVASINMSLQAYDIAHRNNYIEHELNGSDILSKAYYQIGDYKNAYHFFAINKSLNDTLTRQKLRADIVSMQTRFDVTQKDKTIQLLNENAQIQQQLIKRKNTFNFVIIALFILIAIIAYTLYNRYKLKQQLNQVQMRNIIAADLHDDIGSTLSSIRMYSDIVRMKIENDNPEAGNFLSKMSESSREMIDNMSDIVWAIKPANDAFENIVDRMYNFASELCSAREITFKMPRPENLSLVKIGMLQRRDIYLIFKEAINNAVKYAN